MEKLYYTKDVIGIVEKELSRLLCIALDENDETYGTPAYNAERAVEKMRDYRRLADNIFLRLNLLEGTVEPNDE